MTVTPTPLRELCEIPNFCAVKDSSGDLGKQASLIRTGLPVMNGADHPVPFALFAGCSGLIWGRMLHIFTFASITRRFAPDLLPGHRK